MEQASTPMNEDTIQVQANPASGENGVVSAASQANGGSSTLASGAGGEVPHTIFLCYHCATPGSPEEWGSEAEELVAVSWTCVDSALNQVIIVLFWRFIGEAK